MVWHDDVFVINNPFAPLSKKILTAIKTLSDKSLKFLVNTCYYGDHYSGDENMTYASAAIIAHDNVKKRLEAKQRGQSLKPKAASPIIIFNVKLNITINGESVAIFHVSNAHADDASLCFSQSTILQIVYTYFNNCYPHINLNSGGW